MVERFASFVARRAWLCVVATLALLALASVELYDFRTGKLHLEVDPSANRLLPESRDPRGCDAVWQDFGNGALLEERKFYDCVRRRFGSDETLLVALAADDLFTHAHLERLAALTQKLERVEGVHHVVSLANAQHLRGTPEGIEIGPLYTRAPTDPAKLAELRAEALGNPLYAGNLISRDGRAAAILVYFHEISDRDFIARGIDGEIQRIAREEAGDAHVWLTGTPHVKVETTRMLMKGMATTGLLSLAAPALVLALAFRTVRGVVVPLATILVSLVLLLGFVARFGGSLNLVTVLVPPMLATLGLSYSMHVVAEYYELEPRPGEDRRGRVARALGDVLGPELLTSATTAIGFASLVFSPMGAVREFGVYSLVGVAVATAASMIFLPAVLALLPAPRLPEPAAHPESAGFLRFLEGVARFDLRHRRAILIGAGVVFAASLYGASRIHVGTDHITKFPAEAPVRRDFEAINEYLEGANPFYVIVGSDYADALTEPVNLRAIEQLQEWLEAQPEIGGTTSLVDYVKLINRGINENDPAKFAIPDSQRLTSQLLLFGASEELERFADSRFQFASVMVRGKVIDSDEVAALIQRIERRLLELPGHLRARVTGNPVLLNETIDDIMRGQAWSMVSALGLIYLVLAGMFVSLRVGFLALIPNALPIAAYFGLLGFTGINLAPGTSMVGPIALGIAVDDSIHYLSRFNQEARRLADEREATVSALRGIGRPVAWTTASLVLGFLALTQSELRTQVEVGATAAFALAFAWLCDMLLTPALCAGLRITTLWDVLTLDLGPRPQDSIPVLAGLSSRAARIVALMSEVLTVPAGRRLIRSGEVGEELYVVIDGTLRASVKRDEGEIELARHSRGEVVGEVGLFHHRRTADVDALTDARVLRFTPESLERLARRYPRISGRVHRNLGEVLAGRLAKLTERLR